MEELFTVGEAPAQPGSPAEETPATDGTPAAEQTDTADCTPEELEAWAAFERAYPDVTAENIPEDVFRLVSEGETPVHAMRQVELAQLKAENRALKQRLSAAETARRNRLSTPGSMLGRAEAEEDAFLAGLKL